MGKWALILVAAVIGLAVLGFLVDAARAIVGVLLVICLIALAVQVFWKRTRKDG